MSVCETAGVVDEVGMRRWDQSGELGDELLGRHVDEAALARQVEADATIGQQMQGIEGEGRSQEVLADALEAFAIATVDGGGGVQAHAVRVRDEAVLERAHAGGRW